MSAANPCAGRSPASSRTASPEKSHARSFRLRDPAPHRRTAFATIRPPLPGLLLPFACLAENTGSRAGVSILAGYDEARGVDGVVFENLRVNGRLVRDADQARFFVGEHVSGLEFRVDE